MKKALFLDRDGIINKEVGDYVHRVEDVVLLPGTIRFMQVALEKGYLLIVISNQSGISKGYYEHGDVEKVQQYIEAELEKEGIHLTDFFYAPHHPQQSNSLLRKPDSLMLEKAMAKHGVAPEKSLFIGDKETDKVAGEKAGIPSFQVESNSDLMELVDKLDGTH